MNLKVIVNSIRDIVMAVGTSKRYRRSEQIVAESSDYVKDNQVRHSKIQDSLSSRLHEENHVGFCCCLSRAGLTKGHLDG